MAGTQPTDDPDQTQRSEEIQKVIDDWFAGRGQEGGT